MEPFSTLGVIVRRTADAVSYRWTWKLLHLLESRPGIVTGKGQKDPFSKADSGRSFNMCSTRRVTHLLGWPPLPIVVQVFPG